jgi:hypothetical protein
VCHVFQTVGNIPEDPEDILNGGVLPIIGIKIYIEIRNGLL